MYQTTILKYGTVYSKISLETSLMCIFSQGVLKCSFKQTNDVFNGSQVAKLKRSIPLINLYSRSSKSKKLQCYSENYDFCEYIKFGAIS